MPEKPRELLRVGLGDAPMPVSRLLRLIEAAEADDTDTVRHRNGSLIIERPVEEE